MVYLLIGFLSIIVFAVLVIRAADKVQGKKRNEKRGKEPVEKTGWLQTPSGKNLKTASILTAIYLTGFWLLYGPLAGWLRSRFGFSNIQSWSLVTLLGLAFIFPSVWLLYSAANIPGDPKNVKRGMRLIAFAVLLVLAYIKWSGPSELFNSDDGKAKFWIDKTTGEMVYDPSADSSKTRYSSKTGHRLKLGEPEDVKLISSQQTAGTLVSVAVNATKNLFMAPAPVETIITLTESQRAQVGPTTYKIPAGTGWSAPIIYTGESAPQYKFLTDVETQVHSYADGAFSYSAQTYTDGYWKRPVPDGPSHYNVVYFEGTTSMGWKRLPVDYYIRVYW